MVFDVSGSPTFQENIRVSLFLLTSLDHLPSPELLKSLRICQTLEEGSLATPYSTGSCYLEDSLSNKLPSWQVVISFQH